MAVDVAKHLERAKKYLEKNKLQEAIEEYKAVLEAVPTSQDVMQALGDLHVRRNEPERAAQYYGMLFDKLADSGNAAKAAVLYTRFLKPFPLPPDRLARYALLLQRQNKPQEAIEHYAAAAELHLAQGKEADALACWEKVAQLDPDNPARHLKLGEVGERLGKNDIAARGYLRAGQLALSGGELDRGLDLFGRAHRLAPGERSVALFYAEALLRKGDAGRAVELLEPFSAAEMDPSFLTTFADALMHHGQLDRARGVFEQFYRDKRDAFAKLFELADAYVKAGQDEKGVALLSSLQERMFAARQQAEFTEQLDAVGEANQQSVQLSEYCARIYSELNRESKYFDVLMRLFDAYHAKGNIRGACDSLDRLVDIDPYDFRNQERMALLEGKADPAYLRGLTARMAKAAQVGGQPPIAARVAPEAAAPISDEAKARTALDDLLVQTEIFLQYSMRDKATERLQRIAEMFPGEEERNERLRHLYQQADWWPPGSRRGAAPAAAPAASVPAAAALSPAQTGVFSADTVRDLARISEITRDIYRQATPKAVLSAAVNAIGKYLRVTRCLGTVGAPGQPPQMASEFCAAGAEPSGGANMVKLLGQLAQASPDALGTVQLDADAAPLLRDMGLQTVLAVPLTDKESQSQQGMLLLGHAGPRQWKPNEAYFLLSIGDQVLLSVNHTKLRSLVRNLNVADEKTGLLGRSSYLDCLLSESNRARTQSTPLSLVILQMDRGVELLRQQGEAVFDRFVEQLARTLQASIRQNDTAIKYTSWALAFVLPDTKLANAKTLAEKLRKGTAAVRPPWDQAPVKLSGVVAEAVARPDYDNEDIVTDLINRAELGLEEARKQGEALVSL